jgi:xanthosine utilization system XapX-like protein
MKLVLAVVTGVVAGLLFGQVVPPDAAIALGMLIGLIELVGAQRGQSIRALLKLDAVVISWPLTALVFHMLGVPHRGLRIALAAAVAATLAAIAAGRGAGQDGSRLRVVILSILIVGYAILRSMTRPVIEPWALIAACLAAAIPLLVVAGGAIMLPDRHRIVLRMSTLACAWGALVVTVAAWRAGML